MAKNQLPPSVPEQEYQYRSGQSVREAMLRAGGGGKGIIGRASAGLRASLERKMTGMYGDESTKISRVLRLMGKDNTAEWIDRFFALPKKTKRDVRQPIESNQKINSISTDMGQIKGMLVAQNVRLISIHGLLGVVASDVADIKSIISPKGVVAFGKKGTPQEGAAQFVQYNPMAPAGEQYRQVTSTGKLTPMKPGKAFQDSATQKAALETAKLAVKIQQEETARAELRKKYSFREQEEKFKEESPLEEIKDRLDDIEGKLDKKKKGGLLAGLMTFMTGLIGGFWKKITGMFGKVFSVISPVFKILKTVAKAVGSLSTFVIKHVWKALRGATSIIRALGAGVAALLRPLGITIPGLVGAGGAVAVTAGISKALDSGMKRTADKEVDKVLTDVTKNQTREGFDPEQSYQAYKLAMDKSLASELDQSRQDYKKQQWTGSEGLSDLERRMAARYFHEKEGRSKGPTSRGVPRGTKQETIPAEIYAEGSDTVDTNYPDAKPTGSLQVMKPVNDKELLDLIARGEGTSDEAAQAKGMASGYDVTLGYGAFHKPTSKPLSKMTLREVRALQSEMLNHPDNNLNSSAAGKYQIVRKTLFGEKGAGYPNGGLMAQLGLKDSDIFSPELQDRLGMALLRGRGLNKYRVGQLSTEEFQRNLAKEWASVADPNTGRSFYGQHTGTSTGDIRTVLAGLGPQIDTLTRQRDAMTASSTMAMSVMAPTVVTSSTTSPGPRQRMPKADTMTADNTLIRAATRDAVHPTTIG